MSVSRLGLCLPLDLPFQVLLVPDELRMNPVCLLGGLPVGGSFLKLFALGVARFKGLPSGLLQLPSRPTLPLLDDALDRLLHSRTMPELLVLAVVLLDGDIRRGLVGLARVFLRPVSMLSVSTHDLTTTSLLSTSSFEVGCSVTKELEEKV